MRAGIYFDHNITMGAGGLARFECGKNRVVFLFASHTTSQINADAVGNGPAIELATRVFLAKLRRVKAPRGNLSASTKDSNSVVSCTPSKAFVTLSVARLNLAQ